MSEQPITSNNKFTMKQITRIKITLIVDDKSESLAVTTDDPVDGAVESDEDEEEDDQEGGDDDVVPSRHERIEISTPTCIGEEGISSETTIGLATEAMEGRPGSRSGMMTTAGSAGVDVVTESTSLINLTVPTSSTSTTAMSAGGSKVTQMISNRESMESKRERKAAKTLVIITGAFVVCWLPFFVTALILPICGESCPLPDFVFSIFLWLGYINSMINPIIYTIFSLDFRTAFKKILFGKRFNQMQQQRQQLKDRKKTQLNTQHHHLQQDRNSRRKDANEPTDV